MVYTGVYMLAFEAYIGTNNERTTKGPTMADRIAGMMSELMNDLYEAFENPDAILNPTPAPVDAPAYAISVPGGKAYDAAHLSRSKSRNAQLLVTALQDLAQAKDDATRDAIRVFAKACIDAL